MPKVQPKTKVCCDCDKRKGIKDFWKQCGKKSYYSSRCRKCRNIWQENNRDKTNPKRVQTRDKRLNGITCEDCGAKKPWEDFGRDVPSWDRKKICNSCENIVLKKRTTKSCGKCKKEKDVSKFCKNIAIKGGVDRRCRKCHSKAVKAKYKEDKKEKEENPNKPKTCTNCKEAKTLKDFHTGFAICADCTNEKNRNASPAVKKKRHATMVAWRKDNKVDIDRKYNDWRKRNWDKVLENSRKWAKNNPEKRKKYNANYLAKPGVKEMNADRQREFRKKYPEKSRAMYKAWRENNPDKYQKYLKRLRKYWKRKRIELTDDYVCNKMKIKLTECPPEVIRAQRKVMLINRLIKQIQQGEPIT